MLLVVVRGRSVSEMVIRVSLLSCMMVRMLVVGDDSAFRVVGGVLVVVSFW